jgi:succinoglycan biosynthesis protein ExoA
MHSHQNILVVIPTLNESAHISQLLYHLLKDLPDGQAQVVVADGGSTDGTTNIVRRMSAEDSRIYLIHNPKRLQSCGINLAVREFGHAADILIRCDAHSGYPDNYVRDLASSLARTNTDAVVVPMDTVGGTCLQKAIAWVSNSKVGTGGSAHRAGRKSEFVDHGHHAAMSMDAFRKVGGYDETFSHNEDAEFDCRLRHVGGRIYLDANIRIEYEPRSSLASLWKQYFNYGRGRSRTVRKHPASLRLRQFLVPAHVVAMLASVLAVGAVGDVRFLAWPLVYLAVLLVYSAYLSIENRSKCGLLAAPAAFVMHTSWAMGFFWGLMSVRERPWTGSADPIALQS